MAVDPNTTAPERVLTQEEIDADGQDADWVECWQCGGEGEIEDEDWQFEGEFYTCDICHGKCGWPRSSDPFQDED